MKLPEGGYQLVESNGKLSARIAGNPEPVELPIEPVAVEVPIDATEGSSDDVALLVGLGAGAAALVATAVVLAVVFGTQSSHQTQPASPFVVGF